MEELKVQNSLLLQLINSKNRQNQILFQQYDQLAADNRHLQAQTDQLRTLNNQLKKQIPPAHPHQALHQSPLRPSPFDLELQELKKKNGDLMGMITGLKAKLEERGGSIILLQDELQRAKIEGKQAADEQTRELKAMLQLKEQAVAELTEYMQVQEEKISELTRQGILAIDNYEAKLTEKDTLCQKFSEQIAQLDQKITKLQVLQVKVDFESPVEGGNTSGLEGQKVKELYTIILLKEQSIAQLSEFLQIQSDKVSKLQAGLSQYNLKTLQDEMENLKQIVANKDQSIAELSDFLNFLSIKNKEYEQKLQIQQQKSLIPQQADSDTVVTLQNKVQQLVQQIASQNEQQLKSKPSEYENFIRESEMLRARLSKREDEVALLSSKVEEMEVEIINIRLQLDDKIVKITMLESISQQNDAEFPNDKYQGGNEKPKAQITAKRQETVEVTDIQGILKLKQSQIQTLKAIVEQKDQSLKDFTDFISQQTDKITTLQHNAEELEAIIKYKEQSIEQLRTFLEESYTKNAQLTDRNRLMQDKASILQEQLDNMKKKETEKESQYAQQRIDIVLPPSNSELGSPFKEPHSSSLQDHTKQLQTELTSKTQTIAELSEFMNSQAESLRAYKQKQEQNPNDRIAELEAIIKLKEQSNNELSAFLEQAYAKTAEMDLSLNESQRNMLNSQQQLFVIKTKQGVQGNAEENNLAKNMRDTIQELKVIIAEKQYSIQELQKSNRGTVQRQEAPSPSQIEQQLREQIQTLENTLADKDGKIEELTDFMNQQAEELDGLTSQLEAKHGSPPCAFQSASEQDLRRQIDELTETMKSKDENIMELAEFMTQQAEELQALKSSLPQEGQPSDCQQLLQKLVSLQQIIKSKEFLQSETNQSLQEAYSKIKALEQQKRLIGNRQAEQIEKMSQQQNIIRQLDESNNQALTGLAQAVEALNQLAQKYAEKEEELRQIKQQAPQQTEQDGIIDETEIIKALKIAIQQLEDVLNTKSETIAELSQFMNEQSLRVEELEAQLNAPQGSSNNSNKEKIEELQTIIKYKEASIAELTSYLEEAYAKNAELQALASVKSQEQSQQNQQGDNKEIKVQPYTQKLNQQQADQQQIGLSEKEYQLERLNSEMEAKKAQISKLNTLLQDVSKKLKEQESKFSAIKAGTKDAQNSYNQQLDEYNQHRESMELELGNLAQALQEQVAMVELRESDLGRLEQKTGQLNSEIKQLEDAHKGLKMQGETKKSQVATFENASPAIAELQAKVAEYEGFLNDREEEMAAMMEVMENLQAEIYNKNEMINQLQDNPQRLPDASSNNKIQQLQSEIMSFRPTFQDLQGGYSTQQKQIKVLGGYDRLQIQGALREQSNKLKQQYQQELNNMKNVEMDLQRELNLNGEYNAQGEQVDNNEQLSVLQVIEQILVYFEKDLDLGNILGLLEVLKRSYLRENQCILKENNQLKDTLNNLLEINNNLVEEIEKMKAELDQQRSVAEKQQQRVNEAEERAGRQQINYQQEIKQLRRSITGLRDESPIGGKAREQDLHTISRLQDEVVALRQENQQREVQLEQLKANSNKKFVNELNNLLDSCTVAKEGEELRELQQELERVVAERDELVAKCKDYEGQVLTLQNLCAQLAASIENAAKKQPQTLPIQISQGQDSLQTAQLLAGMEQPAHESQRRQSELEESSIEKLRGQNQQLNILLQQKSAAINELQDTMLGLQKGYNSEIMSLRKNIAELKNEGIALRKSLYQANPDGVDIHELIKDTFDHDQRDTDFFRPNYPTYTHSLLLAHHNNSYSSDAHQRPPSQYQRFFPPNTQLNMGEKFMGRRCRQASPFSYGGETSKMTVWQGEYPRY